jgi:HSP20 family molecular chaperone IbpA
MNSTRSINLMWNKACESLERADRLQRQFFRLGQIGQLPAWEPPIDVFESDSELLIRVAIPDVNRDDLKIQLEPAALRLSGRRCLPKEAKQRVIRRLEIPYGLMERYITLPPGRFRIAAHSYNNGCLEIRLRRMYENA